MATVYHSVLLGESPNKAEMKTVFNHKEVSMDLGDLCKIYKYMHGHVDVLFTLLCLYDNFNEYTNIHALGEELSKLRDITIPQITEKNKNIILYLIDHYDIYYGRRIYIKKHYY